MDPFYLTKSALITAIGLNVLLQSFSVFKTRLFKSFRPIGDFCHLLINFAYSLERDQDR